MAKPTSTLYLLKSLRLSTETEPVYLGWCAVPAKTNKLLFQLHHNYFPRFCGYYNQGEPLERDEILIQRVDLLEDGKFDYHDIDRFGFDKIELKEFEVDTEVKSLRDRSIGSDNEEEYANMSDKDSSDEEDYVDTDWIDIVRSRNAPFVHTIGKEWTFHLEPNHEPPSINLLSVAYVMRRKS